MVRCGQNRSETKYLADCVNARDAVNRLEVVEEQARRADLEAQSERKRQALRRTQEAVAEARRRAREAQIRRDQAEYLGVDENEVLDGTGLAGESGSTTDAVPSADGNAPGVEISPPEPEVVEDAAGDLQPESGVGSDLESIREELKRRQENPQ